MGSNESYATNLSTQQPLQKNYDSEKAVGGSKALGASNTTWTRHVFFTKDMTFY